MLRHLLLCFSRILPDIKGRLDLIPRCSWSKIKHITRFSDQMLMDMISYQVYVARDCSLG